MFEIDGEALRRLREERFLSQVDLAELADMTQSTISRLELGKQPARGSTIRRLAKALGVAPNDLIVKPS